MTKSLIVALVFLAGAAAAQVPVQILGSNCTGFTPGGPASAPTLTCVTSSPPSVLTCSILGAPAAPVAIGSSVSLSANCSHGSGVYSYSWTPGGSTAATIQANTSVAGSTAYTLTARDSLGSTATAQAMVAVTGGSTPADCAGKPVVFVDISWDVPKRAYARLRTGDFAVVRFTPTSASVSMSNVTGAEWGSSPAQRVATLSTKACEFAGTGGGPPPSLGWSAVSSGTTISNWFAVGKPDSSGYYPGNLPIGSPLYVNVQTTGPCNSGICDMYFDLSK